MPINVSDVARLDVLVRRINRRPSVRGVSGCWALVHAHDGIAAEWRSPAYSAGPSRLAEQVCYRTSDEIIVAAGLQRLAIGDLDFWVDDDTWHYRIVVLR